MIAEYDDMVGEYLEALRDQDLLDNTIVILSSDHGDMQMQHQQVGSRRRSRELALRNALSPGTSRDCFFLYPLPARGATAALVPCPHTQVAGCCCCRRCCFPSLHTDAR